MRVALYARVSTEEQALHGLSIDAQIAALDEWAKDKTVVDHYIDLGISARKPISKRPELQRLLRDVEEGKIDLVAFTKLDRWTRNIREYYKCQDILEAHGVSWVTIFERYGTNDAQSRLLTNLMLSISQDEADRTSERIKAVFDQKRKKGLATSGAAPFGLRIEEGLYVPGDDADEVKRLFNDYLNLRSVSQLVKTTPFTYHGLRRMLTNPHYVDAGVIDEDTFGRVQKVLEERSQRHVRSDRVYLFSGLVVCPYCGRKLSSCMVNGYKYYRCQKHLEGKCEGKYVSERKMEKYLLHKIMPAVEGYNLRIQKEKKKDVDVGRLKEKQNRLTDLYLNDLIDREKYEREFTDLRVKIENATLEAAPIDPVSVKTILDAYNSLADGGKRIFWSRVLKSVTPKENGFDFALNYTYRNKTSDILQYVQTNIFQNQS